MTKLEQIEVALRAVDAATFQRLGDAYLVRRGYHGLHPNGLTFGSAKTATGTPDTFVARSDGQFIFIEYSTEKRGLAKKFAHDLAECFDEVKTGVPVKRIAEVVLCYTGRLTAEAVCALGDTCRAQGVDFTAVSLGMLAHDLCDRYPGLAREFLGVEVDTGQVLRPDEFVAAYGRSAVATPLDTTFRFRDQQADEIAGVLDRADVVLVAGRPGVGKTRLALESARRYAEAHPGAEVWCVLHRGASHGSSMRSSCCATHARTTRSSCWRPCATIAAVALLRVVDRTNEEQMSLVTALTGLTPDVFWRGVQRLHALEVFDLHEDEVVRVADQVLASYLLYLAAFTTRVVDFGDVLGHMVPRHRARLVDATNPIVSAFDREIVFAVLRPAVTAARRVFDRIGDVDARRHLLDLFWFVTPAEALAAAHDEVLTLSPEPAELAAVPYQESGNAVPSASALSLLAHFGQGEEHEVETAVDLLGEYVERRPAEASLALRVLNDAFGVGHGSHLHGFERERWTAGALRRRAEASVESPSAHVPGLYLSYAAAQLRTRFHQLKSAGGAAFRGFNFHMAATDEGLALRRASAPLDSLAGDLTYIARYHEVDPELLTDVVRVVVDRQSEGAAAGHILASVVRWGPGEAVFMRLIQVARALAEAVYLVVAEVDVHADYNGTLFDALLDADPTFAERWAVAALTSLDARNPWHDGRDYTFLWRRVDHAAVITRMADVVRADENPRHLFRETLDALFPLLADAPDADALRARQDAVLDTWIAAWAQERGEMVLVFDIICEQAPERRRDRLATFLAHNADPEDFAALQLEPTSRTWSGSAVPMYQRDVDYYESLLPLCRGVTFLRQRQQLERRIAALREKIEREKRRDFVGGHEH